MLGITFVAFILIHLIPGNPAKVILYGSQATPQQIANLTTQLGLNQPLWEQYGRFLGQLLRGNLGTSYLTQTSVAHELLSRTPSTLILTGSAMLVAIVIGVPLGVLAGARPGSLLDRAARGHLLPRRRHSVLLPRPAAGPAAQRPAALVPRDRQRDVRLAGAAGRLAWLGVRGDPHPPGPRPDHRGVPQRIRAGRPGPGDAVSGGSCCGTRCATPPSRPSPSSACSSATSSPGRPSPR